MTTALTAYEKRMADIGDRSDAMRDVLLNPLFDTSSGDLISDPKTRKERVMAAAKNSIYESIESDGRDMILSTHARSLMNYTRARGQMPSDELLASAHAAIANALAVTSGNSRPNGFVLESAAPMSTTEGIQMRDRMIALILPVLLQSITSGMVTHVPGQFNQSEMFRIHRIAGSTFGDLVAGDRIDYRYNGRYSVMDQRRQTGVGDGTKTGAAHDFKLDTNVIFGKVHPVKRKSVRVLHDRDVVASDNGSGSIFGSFKIGETIVNVSGVVDYAAGTVDPVFSVPPAAGIKIDVGYDVDIERDPTLIPKIDHEMESAILYPHEGAIAGSVSLQALWGLRREYNVNAENMQMQAMRNLLVADKDRKILRDLYFFARGETTWNYTVPDNLYFQEHYETLKEVLLTISSMLSARTGISGLVGLVADTKAVNLFKAMKAPFFEPAPNYRELPQAHYVGRVFGMWDLYQDPHGESYSVLCYAKGAEHGQAGYVAGDAIPALSFKHPTMTDLQYKNTLWELSYRDINPFDGRDYFTMLKFLP